MAVEILSTILNPSTGLYDTVFRRVGGEGDQFQVSTATSDAPAIRSAIMAQHQKRDAVGVHCFCDATQPSPRPAIVI